MVAVLLLSYSQQSTTFKPAEDKTGNTVLFKKASRALGHTPTLRQCVGLKHVEARRKSDTDANRLLEKLEQKGVDTLDLKANDLNEKSY